MTDNSKHNSQTYEKLYKYLYRAFSGDNFAAEYVVKITPKIENEYPGLYDDVLADVMNNLSEVDEYILGTSIERIYRAAYSDYTKLDAFFELYDPPSHTYGSYNFEKFCLGFGYDPNDLALFPITGNSMINAGINDGDTAIVNLKEKPQIGDIAAVSVKNKYFIKRISSESNLYVLISENPDYPPYKVKPDDNFRFLGKVTNIIKSIKK